MQLDDNGNLYGVAIYGASNGNGTVFQLDTAGNNFKVLHAFTGGTDGSSPVGLAIDKTGSTLYGATHIGGDLSKCVQSGCGVVFKLGL